MEEIKIFRTLFPHLDQNFSAPCFFLSPRAEIKKCRNAYLSSIPASYPGRELNPHGRYGHRILSPAITSCISTESRFWQLHFDAKSCLSAL